MTDEIVIVVAGGEPPPRELVRGLPSGAPVIAADGGLENARTLGLEPNVAVGDFDSASQAALDAAVSTGVRVVRYPEAKNATDLELALDVALELGPARIHVLADDGGRLDHLLAALLLLASPKYEAAAVDGVFGAARLCVIRGERTLAGEPGELVSLVALHGRAEGVSTEGLEYPLSGETLETGSTRGVSNVFTAETARVRVERGVLLAIQPGRETDS
ncbi:MAG: thiamine diphosphokinase [Actinobacteria bacterium]|nr:thiamine diphosphokinase [Actinomycetota bacterium]